MHCSGKEDEITLQLEQSCNEIKVSTKKKIAKDDIKSEENMSNKDKI